MESLLIEHAYQVGVGAYKLRKSQNEKTHSKLMDCFQGCLADKEDKAPANHAVHDYGDIAELRKNMQKLLDTQALLVARFKQALLLLPLRGSCARDADISNQLDALHAQTDQGFDKVISSIDDADAVKSAKDLKEKCDLVIQAYDPLLLDLVNLAVHQSRSLSDYASEDANKAEARADYLYSSASECLSSTDDQAVASESGRLEMLPYIVCMACAVRVKLDVHLVRSHFLNRADRAQHLKKGVEIVERFVEAARLALGAVTANTSLLGLGVRYSVPVAVYMTLVKTLRSSAQAMVSSWAMSREVERWDDGLGGIRTILCREDSDSTIILLVDAKERTWWTKFIGCISDSNAIRESVSVEDFVAVLGAKPDDQAQSIRLVKDYKHALLQLPSVHSLRSALLAKLATADDIKAPRPEQDSTIATIAEPLVTLAPHLAHSIKGHSDKVNCVAVSADGKFVASGSEDKTAKVWSTARGELINFAKSQCEGVVSIALSAHAELAVLQGGDDDTAVRIWKPMSDHEMQTLKGHTKKVLGLALSACGDKVASTSWDLTIKVWKLSSGCCEATLQGHRDWVKCVAFSPDGHTLASGGLDKTINLWDVTNKRILHSITDGHTAAVNGVAFAGSDSGELLVSCSNETTIKVWKSRSGEKERELRGHSSYVTCLAVFGNGDKLASGSGDKSVRIWNLKSGALEHVLTGHAKWVRSLAVSRSGHTLVSGSDDKTIKVWKLVGKHAIAPRTLPQLVSTPPELVRTLRHPNIVWCVAMSADGERIVSGSQDKTAEVWSRATGQLLCTFANHSCAVVSVAFFSDNKRVVSGGGHNDKTVRIWSLEDSGSSVTELQILTGHTEAVWGLALSPDDSTVASGSLDKTIKLWDTHSGHCEATLTGHSDRVWCVAFSLDGRTLASGSGDKRIKLWNVRSHSVQRTLTGHTGTVYGVAFAGADGDRLVSCSEDTTIKVWKWQSGQIERTLTGHISSVRSVAVFPCGERLASGSADYTIKIWNVHNGRLVHTLVEHTNWVRSVAVSRDGHTLVSGSSDQSVKVWRVR